MTTNRTLRLRPLIADSEWPDGAIGGINVETIDFASFRIEVAVVPVGHGEDDAHDVLTVRAWRIGEEGEEEPPLGERGTEDGDEEGEDEEVDGAEPGRYHDQEPAVEEMLISDLRTEKGDKGDTVKLYSRGIEAGTLQVRSGDGDALAEVISLASLLWDGDDDEGEGDGEGEGEGEGEGDGDDDEEGPDVGNEQVVRWCFEPRVGLLRRVQVPTEATECTACGEGFESGLEAGDDCPACGEGAVGSIMESDPEGRTYCPRPCGVAQYDGKQYPPGTTCPVCFDYYERGEVLPDPMAGVRGRKE